MFYKSFSWTMTKWRICFLNTRKRQRTGNLCGRAEQCTDFLRGKTFAVAVYFQWVPDSIYLIRVQWDPETRSLTKAPWMVRKTTTASLVSLVSKGGKQDRKQGTATRWEDCLENSSTGIRIGQRTNKQAFQCILSVKWIAGLVECWRL